MDGMLCRSGATRGECLTGPDLPEELLTLTALAIASLEFYNIFNRAEVDKDLPLATPNLRFLSLMENGFHNKDGMRWMHNFATCSGTLLSERWCFPRVQTSSSRGLYMHPGDNKCEKVQAWYALLEVVTGC